MTHIKVEGHSEYVREEKSHAIINTDTSNYTSYMKMMENKKKQSARGAVEDLKKISSGEFSTPTLILDSFEIANR